LNFSTENIDSAHKALVRLYQTLRDVESAEETSIDEQWRDKFNQAMDDDFNTPEALAVLFQLSHEVNKTKSPQLAATLRQLSAVLGILQSEPEAFLKSGVTDDEVTRIESLIAARNQARSEKNWSKADELREQLSAMGIELEDGASGTTWRKKK